MRQVKFGCTEVACEDKKQGYINYLYFYDCTLGHSKPVAFIIMLLFLLYCLFLLGDTADEYFCPALQVAYCCCRPFPLGRANITSPLTFPTFRATTTSPR